MAGLVKLYRLVGLSCTMMRLRVLLLALSVYMFTRVYIEVVYMTTTSGRKGLEAEGFIRLHSVARNVYSGRKLILETLATIYRASREAYHTKLGIGGGKLVISRREVRFLDSNAATLTSLSGPRTLGWLISA